MPTSEAAKFEQKVRDWRAEDRALRAAAASRCHRLRVLRAEGEKRGVGRLEAGVEPEHVELLNPTRREGALHLEEHGERA